MAASLASLGPLVGAIDQGTSSTRFLVSTARPSGRHRGPAAPPRPEGSRGSRAPSLPSTPLHPSAVPLGKGRGTGPAAAIVLPEQRRRSARGCRVPAVPPWRSRGERCRGEPSPASLPAAPGAARSRRSQQAAFAICQAFNPCGVSPERNGMEWTSSSGTGEMDPCEFGGCD